MPFFPADFREPDGRFRDLLPGDFVPVLYIMRDGATLCATCINSLLPEIDPTTTDDPAWRIERWALHYEGPPESCDECCQEIEALFGDPEEERARD